MINITKIKLRQEFLQLRNQLMLIDAEDINQQVAKLLIDFFITQKIPRQIIGIYHPIKGEINLYNFYRWLSENNFQLSLPSFSPKNIHMDYRQINTNSHHLDFDSIFKSLPAINFGKISVAIGNGDICEPRIILIPCLGFNILGFRLGYGGGYFDNYLSCHHLGLCLGVAHAQTNIDINLYPDIFNKHDKKLTHIFTQSQIIFSQ